MTETRTLRDALAEALSEHSPVVLTPEEREWAADAILAHPAMYAALTELAHVNERDCCGAEAALRATDVPSDGLREVVDSPDRAWLISHWVGHRCGYVDCRITEMHEHGGGEPMREMTAEERAALASTPRSGTEGES